MSGRDCPLCLERPSDTCTPCAHAFCSLCLDRWKDVQQTCPLCRTNLEPQLQTLARAPPPAAPRLPQSTARTSSSRAAVRSDPAGTRAGRPRLLREQAEREEAARLETRAARAALRARIDQYQSAFLTPSGRPYESLPLITMDEVRQLGRTNKVALAGICRPQESLY